VRAVRWVAALLILALSLLPIARWLDVELTASLDYMVEGWWSGAAIVGLLTALTLLVVHRLDLGAALTRMSASLVRWWDARPVSAIGALAAMAFAVYAFDAWWIFSGRPLLIDEIVQVIQAKIFVSGRLWWPADQYPEFRSIMHLVEQDGRVYGQFPPGGPAMLALGELVGAPWLVNPAFGAGSVVAMALALRWARVSAALSLGATALFAFSPFVVFQSASHMNHVTSLTFLLIATAALVRATVSDRDRPLAGLVCGLGLGMAATIRPLDAAAWAIPAAVWLASRAVRDRRWGAFLASGVGVALPFLVMMWVNLRTTGGALTFGYDVMWGKGVSLGFHTPPWGEPHTVRRGLAMIASYLNRLNDHFFETPVPVLVPVALVIAWARQSSPLERYWFVTSTVVLAAYFSYWHDGYYPGPRFMFTLSPLIALLVARVPGVFAERFAAVPQVRSVVLTSFVMAGIAGIVFVLPIRVAQYRALFTSMRLDYAALAAEAGARDRSDVVLIRESWGSQVLVRLWAREIPRTRAEFLYKRLDTCLLDSTLLVLERDDVRGDDAFAAFVPLLADSSRGQQSTLSPDRTERVLPGVVYPPRCLDRIVEDRGGFGHFAPLWLVRDTPVRFLRDLHERDTLLVRRTDRVWVFRVEREDDAPVRPVLERVDMDSLHTAWGWRPR
jgi:hypothetical protein